MSAKTLTPQEAYEWRVVRDYVPLNVDGKLAADDYETRSWALSDGTLLVAGADLGRGGVSVPAILHSPPEDEIELWRSKVNYAAADLRLAEFTFTSAKAQILGLPKSHRKIPWRKSYGEQPMSGNEALLKHLVTCVEERRIVLAKLQANPPEAVAEQQKRRHEIAQLDENRRRRMTDAKDRISAINI